jgi:hypothetical protein
MISDEDLYDILADHFAFVCEEDSWEKGQDLNEWTSEQMWGYYYKYLMEE